MSEIWYRLNTIGEKNLFLTPLLMDGIVVPAHLLAFYDPSLSNIIKDTSLPFLIDPMTYVWERAPRNIRKPNGELKKSYQKYVDKLDCVIGYNLRNDPPIQQYSMEDLSEFVSKILTFQYSLGTFSDSPRARSIDRIRARSRKQSQRIKPVALIPPYFYFNNMTSPGYQLTLDSARLANEHELSEENNITSLLCFSQEVAQSERSRNKLVEDFSESYGVILWIDSFNDRTSSVGLLRNVRFLVQEFQENGTLVINLYGSYFSELLHYFGLEKFSSGIALSHQKRVDAIAGGGGLPLRYYDPTLKIEILNDVAFQFYSEHPEYFVCECPFCRDTFESLQQTSTREEREVLFDPFFIEIRRINREGKSEVVRPAKMNWFNTRLHFMHARRNEIDEIHEASISQISQSLRDDYAQLRRTIRFNEYNRINSADHLLRWVEAIS